MPTNEVFAGETAQERCDGCGTEVDIRSIFTEESGNHFCLACWLEKGNRKVPSRKLTLVEL